MDRVVPRDETIEDEFDCEIECSDLPYLFRVTAATIPLPGAHLTHLTAPPRPQRGGLSVGIVWAAGTWNPTRSIPLLEIEQLTRIPGVTLFSLQREPELSQLGGFPWRTAVLPAEHEGGSIVDTACTLLHLDLLISADTMVAHLGGALGVRVWTLLPFAADWRWMLDRADSPWYPSMRLFRQPSPGDWKSVLQAVAAELSALREEVTLQETLTAGPGSRH
jgi:hypothetical protein